VWLAAVAAVWALTGCAAEEPAPPPPHDGPRLLSLAPSITRVLVALGAAERIVGVDRYSYAQGGLPGVASLGGLFSPDLERAIELRPTHVLAIETAEQRSFLDRLRERGVRVVTVRAHTLAEVIESFEQIGAAVEQPVQGRALAARVRAELDALARESDARPPVTVAMIVERDPLYAVGGGSFVSELIALAGGRNVFADRREPYPQISLEALADRAPRVLLDTTVEVVDDAALAAARAHWARLPIDARVELLPAGDVTMPGPGLAQAARQLGRRIRGKPSA
jgi:ABC-type Fe3+-hydroxamate transport system substrate-binding protein